MSQVILCYIGGDDYVELRALIPFRVGISRRCVGIIILEDFLDEPDESFVVRIEEMGISADITILNDDGKYKPCSFI